MTLLYVIGAVLWLASVVLAVALCKAAARGDRQLAYDTDPYLTRERRLKVQRTYARQAITPLGHIRLGQDTARHHR